VWPVLSAWSIFHRSSVVKCCVCCDSVKPAGRCWWERWTSDWCSHTVWCSAVSHQSQVLSFINLRYVAVTCSYIWFLFYWEVRLVMGPEKWTCYCCSRTYYRLDVFPVTKSTVSQQWNCDQAVVGSIPGRDTIKLPRSTQPSIPLGLVNRVPARARSLMSGAEHSNGAWAEQKMERSGPKSWMSGVERWAGVGKNEWSHCTRHRNDSRHSGSNIYNDIPL